MAFLTNIMKPKTVIISFICCFAWQANVSAADNSASVQTIVPNKVWHIESGAACLLGEGTGCFCYNGIQTIKVDNVKTFNGKEYYELFSDTPSGLYPNPNGRVVTYVREEGEKVFFYTADCNKEYLMYDFNLNVGDEVFLVDPLFPTSLSNQDNPCELTQSDWNEYKFEVTEVDSIEYNQVKRKMLKLKSVRRPSFYDIWVEGIGCMRGITYHAAQHRSGVKQLKDCYQSDELIFVNENPEYCFAEYPDAINNAGQDLIDIFVDDKNSLHIVNAENIPLFIYDIQGREIQSLLPDNDNYKTDISFLPVGLYIISDKLKSIKFKVIVK